MSKFNLSPSLELIDSPPEGRRIELWKEATEDNILLSIEGEISNQQSITGCVCPLLIYDSYALALNLRIPERDSQNKPTECVESSIFKDFNPAELLLPQSLQSNLGQTILLTAWLLPEHQKQRENWKAIAQNILTNFLKDFSQECPPLYQSGCLFDNPIYEYGSPQYPDKNGNIVHYLVWLFINDSADSNLGIVYEDLIDLFFYRNKITTIYQDNVHYLIDIKTKYDEIRAEFLSVSTQLPDADKALSQPELDQFKQNLKALPKLDIEYTDWLRKFKNNHLTIKINQENYQEKLNRIQDKFPSQDLSFLSQFGTQVALKLQQQIEIELDYFGNGSSLVDKAISSIRGIVEIEQAQRDRDRQENEKAKQKLQEQAEKDEQKRKEAEKERQEKAEKDLQDHIQAIGVGIAAGAIVASSSGLMMEPWSLPSPQQRSKPLHPMIVAILVSSFIAWGAWWIAKRWISKRRESDRLQQSHPKSNP
ncbi:MAG: hypothetical protein F6K32_07280 [Desertifilum sp. SIO1I2]|nr:hypothetical protein [Desertifilum sp. SIO1I2]